MALSSEIVIHYLNLFFKISWVIRKSYQRNYFLIIYIQHRTVLVKSIASSSKQISISIQNLSMGSEYGDMGSQDYEPCGEL